MIWCRRQITIQGWGVRKRIKKNSFMTPSRWNCSPSWWSYICTDIISTFDKKCSPLIFTISFGKTDVTWSQVGAVWWMIRSSKKKWKLSPLLIISSQRFCKPHQIVIEISRYATLLDHQSTQFQSAASHALRGLQLRCTSFRLTCPRFTRTSRTRTAEHWRAMMSTESLPKTTSIRPWLRIRGTFCAV